MSNDIHNPHDKLFKQLLGEKETAASFLESNLPRSIVKHLDMDRLEVLQESFIDAQFVQSESDLLLSVGIAGKPGFVYVLFEHQSSPDHWMLLRLDSYMVRVWKRFERENPQARSLPVILPLVFHHGPKGWQGPLDFHSLFEFPSEEFAPYTPQFRMHLFDLSDPSARAITGSAAVRMLSDILGAYGRADFIERITRAFHTLNELAEAPGFARYFEILFRYVLDVYDIPEQDIIDIAVKSINKDVKENAMTTSERLRQEGRLEGRQESARALLSRMLARRFKIDPEPFLPLLKDLEFNMYEQLSDKILEAENIEEIRLWLEKASRN